MKLAMVSPKPEQKQGGIAPSTNGQKPEKGGYKKHPIPWGWIFGFAVIALILGNLIESKLNAVKPLAEGLIQSNGRIEGDHVIISSKFSGRLVSLKAREGETVKKGQVLLEVSDPQTDAKRDQAAAALLAARAQEQSVSDTVTLTKQTGSALILQAQGQVGQAESAIHSAQSDLARARAAVESAKAAKSVSDQNVAVAQSAVSSAAAARDRAISARASAEAVLASAREDLATANANVDSARAASDQANRQAKRYTTLESQGAVSSELAEQMGTDAALKDAALQAAQHQAVSSQANVKAKSAELDSAIQGIKVADAGLAQAHAQLAASKQEDVAAAASVDQAVAQQLGALHTVHENEARKSQALGQLKQALTAPTQVQVSEKNRQSAEANVKNTKSALAEIDSILQEMLVRSPTAGTVVTRFQDQGEMVSPGSPILEIVDLDKLYLKVYIPEILIGKLRLGLPARIYTDAYPNQPFAAKVGYIASEAEFTPKDIQTQSERVSLMYEVRLYLDSNPGHRLTPGLPADAIIKWKEAAPWEKPR